MLRGASARDFWCSDRKLLAAKKHNHIVDCIELCALKNKGNFYEHAFPTFQYFLPFWIFLHRHIFFSSSMTPAKNAVEDANFLILSISFSLFLFPKMDSMRSRQKPDPREHFRCKTLAHLNFIPISSRVCRNERALISATVFPSGRRRRLICLKSREDDCACDRSKI